MLHLEPLKRALCACIVFYTAAATIMPRRKGARNYKNKLLIRIIAQVLPNGELGWQAVATAYKEAAGEDTVQNSDNIKKHWIRNCCNGMKKPTGQPGGKNGSIHKCIGIEKLIMEKTNSRVYGLGDDSPSNSSLESDEGEGRCGRESFDAAREDEDEDKEDDADGGEYASEDIVVPSLPGLEGTGDDFDAEVAEINTAHTEGDGGDRTTDGQVIGVNEPQSLLMLQLEGGPQCPLPQLVHRLAPQLPTLSTLQLSRQKLQ